MATYHKRDKDGNLVILNEEENAMFERNRRLEDRNSCLMKILGWVLKIIAVFVALGVIGYCANKEEKSSKSDEEEKVEVNDKQIETESKEDIVTFNVDELEDVQPKDIEMEAEENSTNDINVEELSKEEETNNNLNEEVEENIPSSSQEIVPEKPQTDE